MSSVTSRAQPSAVLKATTRSGCEYCPLRMFSITVFFISFVVAGLAIGATQARTKIVQHDINGDINGQLARYQRGLVTHDATLHNGNSMHRAYRVFRSERPVNIGQDL